MYWRMCLMGGSFIMLDDISYCIDRCPYPGSDPDIMCPYCRAERKRGHTPKPRPAQRPGGKFSEKKAAIYYLRLRAADPNNPTPERTMEILKGLMRA